MKRLIAFFIILALVCFSASAQKIWKTDVTNVDTTVVRGHLQLGGVSPSGGTISVNSNYIERNGKPYIPVMGEFHYSRCAKENWDKELKKMKAGGISVVATYLFWNYHEPEEGKFRWDGNADLRAFVKLCDENNLDVVVRIGPYSHGEWRNGGLPDWLYGRPIEVRSNDPEYMRYVERYFKQVGEQLTGLMYKDGGPIIGVQLENEYQHAASGWALGYGRFSELTAARMDVGITQVQAGINSEGNANSAIGASHMKELKRLAKAAGIDTPLYTATGWGFATIVEDGSIPVMAGYAYAAWTPGNVASDFYLFKDIRKHPDYAPVSFDTSKYPAMAAEIGTGMMTSHERRSIVPHESFLPFMVRNVGSGNNGLGYYMYHGGNNPLFEGSNLSYTDGSVSMRSYDYQSPLGEDGYPRLGYKSLKLINYFLQDFGESLAPMVTVIPDSNTSDSKDVTTLRYAIRSNGYGGYVFMHNFQDRCQTQNLGNNRIEVQTKSEKVCIPANNTFTLKSKMSAILPFGVEFGGIPFNYATVQPYCKVGNGFVFISLDGIAPEIVLDGKHFVKGVKSSFSQGRTYIKLVAGQACDFKIDGVDFLVVPFDMALNSYKYGDRLLFSEGIVVGSEKAEIITTSSSVNIVVWPEAKLSSEKGTITKSNSSIGSSWTLNMPEVNPNISVKKSGDRYLIVDASNVNWDELSELYIKFNYVGDRGVCLMNGYVKTDNFYVDAPWIVALKKHSEGLREHNMYFYFLPMDKNGQYLKDLSKLPDFGKSKEYLDLGTPEVIPEYRTTLFITK